MKQQNVVQYFCHGHVHHSITPKTSNLSLIPAATPAAAPEAKSASGFWFILSLKLQRRNSIL